MVNVEEILSIVRKELKANSDKKTLETGQRFFKEEIKLIGVKINIVEEIADRNFPNNKTKKEIFELCEKLFKSGFVEESWIACSWSHRLEKQFTPGDFDIFEEWMQKYISNWAICDTLCNHTVGSFIERYPQYVGELKKWAHSKNRWVRRGAAVTLILPARRGKFLNDIFQIADILLLDDDDLVQKGYGWMLKEASKSHLQEVFYYIVKNKKAMPRTALRYAIEKMPEELKRQAMEE